MVADWLAGTTLDQAGADQSVGTHLGALTYDGSDGAPATPDVVDETRDANVARGDLPATVPALAVTLEDWQVDAATMTTNEQRGTATVLDGWYTAVLFVVGAAVLLRYNPNSAWLVAAGAAAGLAYTAVA